MCVCVWADIFPPPPSPADGVRKRRPRPFSLGRPPEEEPSPSRPVPGRAATPPHSAPLAIFGAKTTGATGASGVRPGWGRPRPAATPRAGRTGRTQTRSRPAASAAPRRSCLRAVKEGGGAVQPRPGRREGQGPPPPRVGRVRPSREGVRQEPAGTDWGGELQGRGPLTNGPSVGSLQV